MIDWLETLGIALDADAILQPALDDGFENGRTSLDCPRAGRRRPRRDDRRRVQSLVGAGSACVRPAGRGAAGRGDRPHSRGARRASIAHPGLLRHDEWLPRFAEAGLDAIEAYHTDHDEYTTARYVDLADRLLVAVSGGSDYHGDRAHGGRTIGSVSLPRQPTSDSSSDGPCDRHERTECCGHRAKRATRSP